MSEIDKSFWEGFEACLEMVLNYIDNSDPHILACVLRDEIDDAADLYRKDD